MNEFKVNEYITLRMDDYEDGITNIFIKGKLFRQCKFLLLIRPVENKFDEILSIEEAKERN